jgi:hypothetical protein
MKFSVKTTALLAMTCATMCLTGCFSLEKASSKVSSEDQVVVRNYGWKLFYFIPVVCGNANESAYSPWVFFRNDVNMDKIQNRLMDFSARQGKTPHKLVYHNYDTVMWKIPLVNIPLPVPYFLCYNEIQLSARLK